MSSRDDLLSGTNGESSAGDEILQKTGRLISKGCEDVKLRGTEPAETSLLK